MRRGLVFAVLVVIVCLTFAYHIWVIPLLRYPLLPGVIVHTAVVGDTLRGATDAHGGTVSEEQIGFAAELLTNLVSYFLLLMVIGRVKWPRVPT
jgi:hypothetical protein